MEGECASDGIDSPQLLLLLWVFLTEAIIYSKLLTRSCAAAWSGEDVVLESGGYVTGTPWLVEGSEEATLLELFGCLFSSLFSGRSGFSFGFVNRLGFGCLDSVVFMALVKPGV